MPDNMEQMPENGILKYVFCGVGLIIIELYRTKWVFYKYLLGWYRGLLLRPLDWMKEFLYLF